MKISEISRKHEFHIGGVQKMLIDARDKINKNQSPSE